jgi:hypothetical protein
LAVRASSTGVGWGSPPSLLISPICIEFYVVLRLYTTTDNKLMRASRSRLGVKEQQQASSDTARKPNRREVCLLSASASSPLTSNLSLETIARFCDSKRLTRKVQCRRTMGAVPTQPPTESSTSAPYLASCIANSLTAWTIHVRACVRAWCV